MLQRALEGNEKARGPNHTVTLRIIHNLSVLCQDQGRLQETETMPTLANQKGK
jgi:hypothetical protein